MASRAIVSMFKALFTFILTLATAWGLLNYFGFCLKHFKYLSNEEKISIAVEYVLSTYPPAINIRKNGDVDQQRPDYPIGYEDVSHFMRANPNCCRVVQVQDRTGYKAPVTYRLLGSVSGFVEVNYKVRYLDENKNVVAKDVTAYVAISNCGHPWSGI